MKRTALALPRLQPSPRPARKSEWLRSALAHHHCPDTGAENEVVVLATGIDQYLQEVFHHLAYRQQDDAVLAQDFVALCAVLGLRGAQREQKKENSRGNEGKDEHNEEFKDACSALPDQLSFKDFHSRLCGYFRVRSASGGTGECAWRLPVSDDTELVERQIRLRWPRVRRRKCVSFDLTNDPGTTNRATKNRPTEDARVPGPGTGTCVGVSGLTCCRNCCKICTNTCSDEVAALRELVEDLRSALQGSDARCLALEVALRREKTGSVPFPSCYSSTISTSSSSITLAQGKLVPTQRLKGQLSGARGDAARRVQKRQDIRDPLLRELKLIRSSRDGQLDEAIKYNERLEEELQWAYQEVCRLQGLESKLRKENAQIRRRAEEAREALSLGLQRVQLIQEQARLVPQLQSRITEMETELLQYRWRCTCLPPAHPEDSCRKTGTDAECLQRAVEGRAASDEEEEDTRRKEGEQCCLKHVCHLHSCGKGCQKNAIICEKHPPDKSRSSTPKDGRVCCSSRRPGQERPGASRTFGKEVVRKMAVDFPSQMIFNKENV